MKTNTIWRVITTLVVLTMLTPTLPSMAVATSAPAAATLPDRELFAEGYVNVRVVAPSGTDLSKYGDFVIRRIPNIDGLAVYYGRVPETLVSSLQSTRGVQDVALIELQTEAPIGSPDPEVETREPPSMEETRARLTALRDNPPEPTTRPEATGWWDVSAGGHNAVEAWEAGYTGSGVAIAVNDSGVDMAHPDFWGTEHRYHNVSGDSYYDYFEGWPVALSPFANYLMAFDLELNGDFTHSNTFAYGPSNFADTSFTGTGSTITFDGTVYTTSGTAHPANPVYHIGYHPDWSLQYYVWGERIGVLVVDEDGDGVYETVYVDLNANYDFRDDKPVRKDTNPADNYIQGADELAWWDADLDGYPDVSGGMLYFIADGDHCPPFFDVYFGCSANGTGYYDPPENGDLVAFMYTNLWDTDHGQLCASNVVGQGNINGNAPDWKPDGMGGLIQGAAPDAELVPVGDIYLGFYQSAEQAWWFQALGYDGWIDDPSVPGGDDALQASSNSFGPWGVYEDGWDEWSRIPTYINLFVNPYTTYFMSSGNTGPGYGTTGAPQPITAIQIGASNQYGSGGIYEPLASLEQITAGDIGPFSSRGPSANNQLVPHLSANGSWGTGALGLNESGGDGWTAWDVWGGTSRSSPLAMGGGAVIMDAYYQAHGYWPDWYEVRQILMQGANHIYSDPMSEGTGYLNIGRSAYLAGGDKGVIITPDYWDAGDFEGMRYPGGFAHIAQPGQVYTATMEVENVGPASANVTVSDYILEESGVYTYTFTTANQSIEDGEFLKPDYLIPIEDVVGGALPGDTVLLTAEILYPYTSFDPDEDEVIESYFRLNPYDWTDINGDGNLWQDLNGDGVVNWDEIDELEYVRITRSYDDSLYQYTTIGDPLNRFHDGIVLGIRHRTKGPEVPTTEITVRVALYRQADWGVLDTSAFGGTFALGGGITTTETITFTAPSEYGLYQGAVQVDVQTSITESYTTIVPVFANVAYQGDLTTESEPVVFGDNEDADQFYSNGYVRPILDWSQGRATGGDWRFFYMNHQVADDPGRQSYLVARTWWDAGAPPADVDTLLLGPDYHFSSMDFDGNGPVFGSSYATPGPVWGPYTLRVAGSSISPQLGNGHWAFETATGGNVDYTIAPLERGLNNVQIHSMRYDGETFREDYEVEVGFIDAPSFLEWDNYATQSVELTTNMTFTEDITVTAYGLTPVNLVEEFDQYAPGPSTDDFSACSASYWYTFTATNMQELTVAIDNFSDGDDLDLFLLYDFNDDGVFNCNTEVIGQDGHGSPDPEVVTLEFPPDGTYQVAVDPYTVSGGGEYFDLFVTGKEIGQPFTLSNLDAGLFGPAAPITFDITNKPGTCDDATRSCISGYVQVWLEGDGMIPLLDIPVHPRYSQVDLSQSSLKWVSDPVGAPGDTLTYTIELVNTDTASGTVIVTDTLPAGVSLVSATPGYTTPSGDTLVWSAVPIAAGGGKIITADYDWVDISGIGTPHDTTSEWVGYWTLVYGIHDDDEGAFNVALPFTYTFFGSDFTDVYVTANGEATFDFWSSIADGIYPEASLTALDEYQYRLSVLNGDQAGPILPDIYAFASTPGAMTNNGIVYTYHDDNGTAGDTSDDRFIIQWDEWHLSWRPCYYYSIGCDMPYSANTYQLILYADGSAKAQYAEINALPPLYFAGVTGDPGVESAEDWTWGTTEGYAWQQTPASSMAWMYVPASTATTQLTVTVQIDDPVEDGWLCNEAVADNGYGQIVMLEDCTEVLQAELDVAKTVDPTGAVITGDVVTYTISIENTGPMSATFSLEDTLDAGLAFGGVVQSDIALFNSGQVVTGTGFITVGSTIDVVYTATVTSTAYNDDLCNDLWVTSEFGSMWDDYTCLTANGIDLSTSKKTIDYAGVFAPGTVITYQVAITNTGTVATSAWITDSLPAGLTFGAIVEPTEAGYIAATHEITASFAAIGPGASASLIYTAIIDPAPNGTLVENEAVIVDDAGEEWVVDADFAVENADFTSSWKDGPLNVVPGDTFTYTIAVYNKGWVADTAVVTDVIPTQLQVITPALQSGVSYDAGTRTISWSGSVAQNDTFTLTIPVRVDRVPSGAMVNTAIIEGGEDIFYTDPVYTEIHSAEFDLAKSIDGGLDAWVVWGETVTYTLYVENTGTISTSVTITDTLPEGVEVLEAQLPPGVSYDSVAHAVSWSGDIDAGSDVTLEIPVKGTLAAAQADKALFNQFTLTDEWGQVYESNMTQLHLVSAELEVVKFANTATAKVGDVVTYTVLIRNIGDYATGQGAAWQATMVDALPDGVTYVPGSIQVVMDAGSPTAVSCTPVGSNIVCTFNVDTQDGLLSDGNEVRIRYAVTVDAGNDPGDLLVNTVSVNDSYDVMSYGTYTVEVVTDAYPVYLPIVLKQ
ncbi:MAG: S8 family serine peptidase [Anaerolineae bacterium]